MGWSYRKMYSIPNPKTPIPITKQQNHRSGTAILAFHRKIPSCFLTELGGYQLALFFRGNEHHQPVNSLGLNITAETQNLASEEWEGQETSGNRDRVRTFSLSWKYQVRGRMGRGVIVCFHIFKQRNLFVKSQLYILQKNVDSFMKQNAFLNKPTMCVYCVGAQDHHMRLQ